MSTKLYCIKHETMVDGEMGRVFGHIVRPLVYPPDWEIDFCEFEEGWATCPPPNSVIEFLAEQEPEPLDAKRLWELNPNTMEMVVEERAQ